MNKLSEKERMHWLCTRWNPDLINKIVIALNQGLEIKSILEKIPQRDEIAPLPDKFDLRGIDLSFQNLRGPWSVKEDQRIRIGVSLKGADLSFANLAWAILPRADFRGAILRNTSLTNAELIFADFSGADLTGADLSGAWLLDTKFYGAKIKEEQLRTRRKLGQLDFDYRAYEM